MKQAQGGLQAHLERQANVERLALEVQQVMLVNQENKVLEVKLEPVVPMVLQEDREQEAREAQLDLLVDLVLMDLLDHRAKLVNKVKLAKEERLDNLEKEAEMV